LAAAITELADDVGRIDILVNNAGSSWFGPSSELDSKRQATYIGLSI
jgi:short-subunit dehydrogenase